MRRHREHGIRRDESGRISAYVRAAGKLRYKRFPVGTSLDTVRRWRLDTRAALQLTAPAAGSLAADIEPFLRQFAHRPRFVRERRRQLGWWAERFPHRSRHSLEATDIRRALADLRRTHAATTCNHYRQALHSLYRCLDGPDAPNPVRHVPKFPVPQAEPRGLSYEMVHRILDSMSDQGEPVRKGQPRAAGSKAKVRCRLMAFTGMRPSEIMRYRPEHWNRVDRVLTVLTGKGGRTRTIPLTAEGEAALRDLEALGAVGRFSTSTVHRAFRLALARLGITGIRPYDLRHSYGTAMYQVTGDTRIVKELLGHSTAAMTERYTLGHVPAYMQIAAARFQKLSNGTESSESAPATVRRPRQ